MTEQGALTQSHTRISLIRSRVTDEVLCSLVEAVTALSWISGLQHKAFILLWNNKALGHFQSITAVDYHVCLKQEVMDNRLEEGYF